MKVSRVDTFPFGTTARSLRVQVGYVGNVNLKELVDIADVEANILGFYGADLNNLEEPVCEGGEFYIQTVWYYNRK